MPTHGQQIDEILTKFLKLMPENTEAKRFSRELALQMIDDKHKFAGAIMLVGYLCSRKIDLLEQLHKGIARFMGIEIVNLEELFEIVTKERNE